MKNAIIKLAIDEITQTAILVARQFSIKLGIYTLPEIFSNLSEKKFVFTDTFLGRISRHLLIVNHKRQSEFEIMYAIESRKYLNGSI